MQLGKKKKKTTSTVIIWKAGNVSNRTVALTYKVQKVNVIMRVRYYAALDIMLPARNELREKKKNLLVFKKGYEGNQNFEYLRLAGLRNIIGSLL